jgi:hypothetical protein
MKPTMTKLVTTTSGHFVALEGYDPTSKGETTSFLTKDAANMKKNRFPGAYFIGMALLLLMLVGSGVVTDCRRMGATGTSSLPMVSCMGQDACMNNTGVIDAGACNGDMACQFNSGHVSFLSCNGDGACDHNHGDVTYISCNGDGTCKNNEGPVSYVSCNGDGACVGNTGNVGHTSCNGDGACDGNSQDIGPGMCNDDNACQGPGLEELESGTA